MEAQKERVDVLVVGSCAAGSRCRASADAVGKAAQAGRPDCFCRLQYMASPVLAGIAVAYWPEAGLLVCGNFDPAMAC